MIFEIPNLKFTDSKNFFLIAGPCIIETEKLTFEIAEKVLKITEKLKIPFIFKASYRKANRSKLESFTGIGDQKSLEILKKVRDTYKVPVLTDIHESHEAESASKFIDIIQIPAFLCRQTELLIAAGKTGLPINIKKGQYLSAEMMKFAIDKVKSTGNKKVMLTERGTMFGYNDLIVDYRNIPKMKKLGVPVVLDCTHSLQQPNQTTGVTGGNPEMIETIALAGIATGADGLFIEIHPTPASSPSDGANMLLLSKLEPLLEKLLKLKAVID